MDQTNSFNADPESSCTKWRNWIGFWFLGLCNNFGYVVMLSAAHDILKKQESQNTTANASFGADLQAGNSSNSSRYDCNPTSTAAVLLADILPSLLLKMSAPFIIHKVPYGFRVLFCVLMAVVSFLVVSFSSSVWMSILGVVFASAGSGVGELSFLSLSVYFNRDVLGGWSSGTGGAGVAGALIYSGLTQTGLSPRVTLLIMNIVPLTMLVSYFLLLVPPSSLPQWTVSRGVQYTEVVSDERECLMDPSLEDHQDKNTPHSNMTGPLSCTEKLQVIKGLLKFVFPLGLVYFAEYFINQGLMELLYFPTSALSHAEQYRWYQTMYQVGVLVSRSSLCCFKIRKLWVLAVLQVVNAVFLTVAVLYLFLPSAWVVFGVIFYEGLLGGASYVNTFYFISKETEERHREFAMSTASAGDSMGIALSAALSFPVHQYFCSL